MRRDGVFTPWRLLGVEAKGFFIMKPPAQQLNYDTRLGKPCLTLGELIARTYMTFGEKDAPNILHMAIEAQVVTYSRRN